jgi:2'-hydroxyisoflavone reductase
MKILVVGGTGFLGGAVAFAAVAAGGDVSIFTRGNTQRELSPSVTSLIGDRHVDLSALQSRRFDVVVDTCAFTPESVSLLLEALSPDIGRYALVSSSSVYSDCSAVGVCEEGLAPCANEEQLAAANAVAPARRSDAVSYGQAYGPLKKSAENVALERLGDRAFILRSGLLVGAGDYTDRLTYWVRRVDQGGRMIAPGVSSRCIQFIDVRDAAQFIVDGATRGLSGVFNLTGLPTSWASFLSDCRAVAHSDSELCWISDDELLAAGVIPWTELPLWIPAAHKPLRHFLEISTAKARKYGLQTRPTAETLGDILISDRARSTLPLKAGLPPEKERALLSI